METSKLFISRTRMLLLGVLIGFGCSVLAADKVDRIVGTGVERNDAAKASQVRINKTAESTDKLASKYKKELKVIDGLKVYNTLLRGQLDDQLAEIKQLRASIDEVSIIERQITPLMMRMLAGLEQFIELDVPFLLKERNNRTVKLRETIARADVSAAEKFRSVLEAFQIEGEYGRTIEAYKGSLDVEGKTREVDFLKVGRVALLYQTAGGQLNGVWRQSERQWVALKSEEYRNHITKGLKIARKQVAPDLLMLPISAAEGL